jgi:hypothetical protein
VKQLLIKSTVQEEVRNQMAGDESVPGIQQIQADILDECRRLIIDILDMRKER